MRILVLMSLLGAFSSALAQTFPVRPIRMVIPFAPGGSTDLGGRLVAQKLGDALGQPVVVDNRAGAGGTLGTDIVAKAAPDGHTVLMVTTGTFGINPALYPKLPYDPQNAFAPIGQVSSGALTFVVGTDTPATNLREFAAHARTRSRTSYASSGSGTPTHLLAVLFNKMIGVDAVHVPFKGGAPALAATIGGETQYVLDVVPTSAAQLKAGRIRILAVTTPARVAALAAVPTVAEAGYPELTATIWNGLAAPASTPRTVIAQLNKALNDVLTAPDVVQRFRDLGIEPVATTPEAFGALIRDEMMRWAALVKQSGATVD